jgi:hypothetical protein
MVYKALGEHIIPESASKEIYLRVRLYLYIGLKYFINAACYFVNSYDLKVVYESSRASQIVEAIFTGISLEIIDLRSHVNLTNEIARTHPHKARKRHK